jgi:hypothetical protein
MEKAKYKIKILLYSKKAMKELHLFMDDKFGHSYGMKIIELGKKARK